MEKMRRERKVQERVSQERRERSPPRRGWRDDTKEARNMAEEDCYGREEWRLGAEKRRSCKIIRKMYTYNLRSEGVLLNPLEFTCKLPLFLQNCTLKQNVVLLRTNSNLVCMIPAGC
jgi:hypothetical protein